MAIESLIVPAATGVIGVVVGLGAALKLTHKGRELPQAGSRDVWQHLKDLTAQRAEAAAKKKALHRAYAAGSVNEHSFITKDAHYTRLMEQLDDDIDKTVVDLSKAFLPEEMQKGETKLKELSDLAVLSKKIEELKQDKGSLEEERGRLYLQLTELEEDKKMELAEKNKIRTKYEEDSARLNEMMTGIEELEKQRGELEDKVAGIQPRDQKIATLQKENRMLRESLNNARQKIATAEKETGVLAAIIDRHAKEIDEAKKTDELKELIQPNNPGVQELVKKYTTAQAAFEFVRDNIVEVHPQVSASYWLEVDDVMRVGAADLDDKSIFLCSMLRALGQEAWVAMVEMKNEYRRAIVLTDDHVLDADDIRKYGDFTGLSADEALGKYMFDGFPVKKLVFKFNEAEYIEPKA